MGIKREGLLYLEKYGIGGPKFGIKEFVTEYGRQLFQARAVLVLAHSKYVSLAAIVPIVSNTCMHQCVLQQNAGVDTFRQAKEIEQCSYITDHQIKQEK